MSEKQVAGPPDLLRNGKLCLPPVLREGEKEGEISLRSGRRSQRVELNDYKGDGRGARDHQKLKAITSG